MTKYRKFPGFNPKKEDLCNALPIPLFVTDIEGKLLYANKSFFSLFKISSLEGIYNETLFGRNNSIAIFNIYEKLYDNNYKSLKISHGPKILEITFYGDLKYIIGTIRDITSEEKNADLMKNHNLYLNLIKSIISTYFDENDPKAAFDKIMNDIMYYVNLSYAQTFLFQNERLVLFYTLGDCPEELKMKKKFSVGEDTPGTAFQLKKIVFVKDPVADTRFKITKNREPLSFIDIPIFYKDKEIGIIEFIARRQLAPVKNVIWDFFPQLITVIGNLIEKMVQSENF
ncbi:MAG: hypothetical protein GWP03_05150 [Proteobacteria bacterium]|nr:hypothetical protein [Pseudomonadota bacterium]